MGQQTSSGKSGRSTDRPPVAATAAMAAALLRLRAIEAKELLKVTRDDLAKIVILLNDVTDNADHTARLEFKVEGATSDSLLWKVTAHVLCTKTCYAERNGSMVRVSSSEWRLSVRQILRLYRDAQRLFSLPELFDFPYVFSNSAGEGSSVDLTESSLRDARLAGSPSFASPPASANKHADDECCICLDSTVNTTLPCAHSFCEDCIGTWHELDSACPMCKQCTEKADDMWIMPTPDPVPSQHCMNAVALISSLIEKLESAGHTSAHSSVTAAPAADSAEASTSTAAADGVALPTNNQPVHLEAAARAAAGHTSHITEQNLLCEQI